LKKSNHDYNKTLIDDLRNLKINDSHKFWKMVSSKNKVDSTPESMIDDLYQHFKNMNAEVPELNIAPDLDIGEADELLNRPIDKNDILKQI
jgi:iron uptake system EfeUOB component EfeO/EfeM